MPVRRPPDGQFGAGIDVVVVDEPFGAVVVVLVARGSMQGLTGCTTLSGCGLELRRTVTWI